MKSTLCLSQLVLRFEEPPRCGFSYFVLHPVLRSEMVTFVPDPLAPPIIRKVLPLVDEYSAGRDLCLDVNVYDLTRHPDFDRRPPPWARTPRAVWRLSSSPFRTPLGLTFHIQDVQIGLELVGRGYGSVGMRCFLHALRERGAVAVHGALSPHDIADHGARLRHFYERHGFSVDLGRRTIHLDLAPQRSLQIRPMAVT